MTEAPRTDAPPFTAGEIEEMARDWITLWQSELSAIASDREMQEAWVRLLSFWAGAATAMLRAMPPERTSDLARREQPGGSAGPSPQAGATAAPLAPSPGDAALERIDRRLACLEERLAILERRLRREGDAPQQRVRPSRSVRRASVPPDGPG